MSTTTEETENEDQVTPAPRREPPNRLRARASGRKLELQSSDGAELVENGDSTASVAREGAPAAPLTTDGENTAAGDPDAEREAKYARLGLGAGAESKAIRQLREEDHKTVASWLQSMGTGEGQMRVEVYRREPQEFTDPRDGQRKKVNGLLRKYERQIDEDEIQKNHGGGSYQLVAKIRNKRGQWDYGGARTIEIGGDPRLDDVPRSVAQQPQQQQIQAPDPNNNPVMLEMVKGMMQQANRPAPAPPDITSQIQLAIAPYMKMIDTLQSQNAEMRREAAEARKGNPEETTFQQKMLDKFVDQDSARLQQVRMQFESEIRVVKEAATATELRLRDQFERDKAALERAHEREIKTIETAHGSALKALESSFAMQKTVLETDNRRLERELTDLRIDVKELRNKKEPSFKDQLSGIRDMKEMISDVIDDGGEKEEKSTLVKVLEGAAQSDVIAGFAQRLMGGGQPTPEQIAAMQAAQQQPSGRAAVRRRGPRLIRDRRNGQVYATDGQKAIPVQKKQPLAAPPTPPVVVVDEHGNPLPPEQQPQVVVQEEAVAAPPEPAIPYIAPEHVQLATQYMTQAFSNKVPADDFVTGIKMFIPAEVTEAIKTMGVDQFLRRVGGLADGHPLLTQAGRNWARKVAAQLTGE